MDLLKKLSLTMLISVSVVCAADDENPNGVNGESFIKTYIQNSVTYEVGQYLNPNLNEETKENSSAGSSVQKQKSYESLKDIDPNEQLSDAIQNAIKKLGELGQNEEISSDDQLFEALKLLKSGKRDDAINRLKKCQQSLNDDQKDLIQQIIDGLEENNENQKSDLYSTIIQHSNEGNDKK